METHEHEHEEWHERVERKLDHLLREVHKMTIDQATFDTDLAGLVTAVTNLTSAVDAWIASHPGVDLTAEDQAVQTASQALADELAKVTPAPAP